MVILWSRVTRFYIPNRGTQQSDKILYSKQRDSIFLTILADADSTLIPPMMRLSTLDTTMRRKDPYGRGIWFAILLVQIYFQFACFDNVLCSNDNLKDFTQKNFLFFNLEDFGDRVSAFCWVTLQLGVSCLSASVQKIFNFLNLIFPEFKLRPTFFLRKLIYFVLETFLEWRQFRRSSTKTT